MKNVFLLLTFLISSIMANAQISDCKQESNYINIYGTDGRYRSRVQIPGGHEFIGFSNLIVATAGYGYINIFGPDGRYMSRVQIEGGHRVKAVVGNTVLTTDGNYTNRYDSTGRYIGRSN
jgi:hypothetical protein